ncbi:MAG TPA: VOC family protein [Actinomycetota bacterium]|nr:VOC family protein [Actinomycetota bacterium]
MTKLNPYLNFGGNAEEAFNFYKSVFGGEFSSMVKFKDMPTEGAPVSEADGDKIMHMALPIGDELLMASDALESFGQTVTPGNNSYISVHPATKDEADRIFNALSEGAEIEMPIDDQMWGDYFGSLKDKFGIGWMVNYNSTYPG